MFTNNNMRDYKNKIVTIEAMIQIRAKLRETGQKLVFTNGCFDILHGGHISYLQFARLLGDALCIGVNSDASVKRLKGSERPVISQEERVRLLAALESVDYVLVFDEDTPKNLISKILPDVLVKGEDWAHDVVGRDIVEANGGEVKLAPLQKGLSTTAIINRIKESF